MVSVTTTANEASVELMRRPVVNNIASAGAVAFGEFLEARHFCDVLHGQSLRYFLLSRTAADTAGLEVLA